LGDIPWIQTAQTRLAKAARKLDALLVASGLEIVGGTDLFRLARMEAADTLFDHLGRTGIFVRAFAGRPDWLRLGLPANRAAWRRLEIALASFRAGTRNRS
jgi:cobalamin biosynthetic protein CobC